MPLVEFFRRGSKKNSKTPGQKTQAGTAIGESSSKSSEQKTAVKNIEKIDEDHQLEEDIKIPSSGCDEIDASFNEVGISVNKSLITTGQDAAKEKCTIEAQVNKDIPPLHQIESAEHQADKATCEITNESIKVSEKVKAEVPESNRDERFEDTPHDRAETATNYLASGGYKEAQINVIESIKSANEEKLDNTTNSTEVKEETMVHAVESISESHDKSLGEPSLIVQSEEINDKGDCQPINSLQEVNSITDVIHSTAEEDRYSDIEGGSDNIVHETENVLIEHGTDPDLSNCKSNTINFEHSSLEEMKDVYVLDKDVNSAQVLPCDSEEVKAHAEVSEPPKIDTKTVPETNIEDNTESSKEISQITKCSETDTEKKDLDSIRSEMECSVNNMEKEECYVQMNLENFESQLVTETTKETTEMNVLTTDKQANLYINMSGKIASESLREALEELNLIFFEKNETGNTIINENSTEINENNNDDNRNQIKNSNENQIENSNENQIENSNVNQKENSKEKQVENDNEKEAENSNENQNENNKNRIKFRDHTLLSKQDSGLASTDSEDLGENTFLPPAQLENNSKQKWRVGYLQVKLPAKSRGKGKLKAWQKRWVVIQNDEFTRDEKNCFLMLSIYHSESGNSRRHSALFWRSVSSKKAVVYRCKSSTHPYAFTVNDEDGPLIHLASNSETEIQEWMAAIRNILWPPNPVMQLEKVLNGNEFDVSFVDNEFSHRAGLLGTYGCLMVTNRKLILNHPQTGHVIQEWYLNTVDKFHILPQPKEEDANKVLLMHTSSDSSTGCGELRLFCNEAVAFLKSLASTIHKVLQYHSRGKNAGRYEKELEELAEWLTPSPPQGRAVGVDDEEYYKVPRRQVRSLLDIPNFIFDKPICEITVRDDPLVSSTNSLSTLSPKLTPSYTSISTFSQDSGISTATSSSDFLNCSQTSFSIGGSSIRRQGQRYQSSSSESSDSYSPPYSPCISKRSTTKENIKNLQEVGTEAT